ncbi:hypothetical protein BDZ91DRAFT_766207 [Kalaharituber pfeilii]|nr:hypothetical protein BDZ91DRAFT_766207 [Kalaharituber pfeilii]
MTNIPNDMKQQSAGPIVPPSPISSSCHASSSTEPEIETKPLERHSGEGATNYNVRIKFIQELNDLQSGRIEPTQPTVQLNGIVNDDSANRSRTRASKLFQQKLVRGLTLRERSGQPRTKVTMTVPRRLEGALIQTRGQINTGEGRCSRCSSGAGVFAECISIHWEDLTDSQLLDVDRACGNCRFAGLARYCSLVTGEPKVTKRKYWPNETNKQSENRGTIRVCELRARAPFLGEGPLCVKSDLLDFRQKQEDFTGELNGSVDSGPSEGDRTPQAHNIAQVSPQGAEVSASVFKCEGNQISSNSLVPVKKCSTQTGFKEVAKERVPGLPVFIFFNQLLQLVTNPQYRWEKPHETDIKSPKFFGKPDGPSDRMLVLPPVRKIVLRPSVDTVLYHTAIHIRAAILHTRGIVKSLEESCDGCKVGNGPFDNCVVLPGEMDGECSNCVYGKWARSTARDETSASWVKWCSFAPELRQKALQTMKTWKEQQALKKALKGKEIRNAAEPTKMTTSRKRKPTAKILEISTAAGTGDLKQTGCSKPQQVQMDTNNGNFVKRQKNGPLPAPSACEKRSMGHKIQLSHSAAPNLKRPYSLGQPPTPKPITDVSKARHQLSPKPCKAKQEGNTRSSNSHMAQDSHDAIKPGKDNLNNVLIQPKFTNSSISCTSKAETSPTPSAVPQFPKPLPIPDSRPISPALSTSLITQRLFSGALRTAEDDRIHKEINYILGEWEHLNQTGCIDGHGSLDSEDTSENGKDEDGESEDGENEEGREYVCLNEEEGQVGEQGELQME